MTEFRNDGIFIEIASVALLPRNDTGLGILDLCCLWACGSGCKKLGSKILERFLVLKPLR